MEIPYGKKIIYGIIAEILEISDEMKNFLKNFEMEQKQSFENSEKNFSIKIPGKFARFSASDMSKNFSENEEIEMKSIISIVSETPILSEYQVTMICRIAMKYILPIHKVLQIFLSEPTLRRLEKYNFPIENFSEKMRKTPKNFDIFLTRNDIITPEKILPFFIPSLVIILPDDILLQRFENFLKNSENIWKEKISFYPAEMTDTKRSQAFIDILNKKSEIII